MPVARTDVHARLITQTRYVSELLQAREYVRTQGPGALHGDSLPRAATQVRDEDGRRRQQSRYRGVLARRKIGCNPRCLLYHSRADARCTARSRSNA